MLLSIHPFEWQCAAAVEPGCRAHKSTITWICKFFFGRCRIRFSQWVAADLANQTDLMLALRICFSQEKSFSEIQGFFCAQLAAENAYKVSFAVQFAVVFF